MVKVKEPVTQQQSHTIIEALLEATGLINLKIVILAGRIDIYVAKTEMK